MIHKKISNLVRDFKNFIIRNFPASLRQFIVKVRNFKRKIPSKAIINGSEYNVVPNKFWIQFNKGSWEPDLQTFFQRHIRKDKKVLDIGGWIGPSVLIACAFHPKKVEVVEANPDTFELLQSNIDKNELNQLVRTHPLCLSDSTGQTVRFGTMDKKVPHSAINGIGGDGYKVQTVSFIDFLKTLQLAEFNIVKIDIEGGERFLMDGFRYLSDYTTLQIFLALHPPFWPDKEKVAQDLLDAFADFDLFTAQEEPMTILELEKAIFSEQKTHYPDKRGQFFDIILKPTSRK